MLEEKKRLNLSLKNILVVFKTFLEAKLLYNFMENYIGLAVSKIKYKYRYIFKITIWIQCWGPLSSARKLLYALLYRLGCVNIFDTIGWYSKTQLKVTVAQYYFYFIIHRKLSVIRCDTWFLVWLGTGSIPADINRFLSHTGKTLSKLDSRTLTSLFF